MPDSLVQPDIQTIRKQFPALTDEFALFENQGGSQVPKAVADSIRNYMLSTYVQLGAPYPISQTATKLVNDAHNFVNLFMNGTGLGEVILGSSTSSLVTMLAGCYANTLKPGDEIVLAENAHEANVTPWLTLEKQGVVIKWWPFDVDSMSMPLEDLKAVLSDRTKIVAFPHVSNLLGQEEDVKAITQLAHSVGARVVADGVAYAVHKAMDVKDWDCDFYLYSTYKVFGPHMAALFARKDALSELQGPSHFFIPNDIAYKFEIGGVNHEGCAGILALQRYLNLLARQKTESPATRQTIEQAFRTIERLEDPLTGKLLDYLNANPKVRVIGSKINDAHRMPTISFVHESISSTEICITAAQHGVGIRNGHMYSIRLTRKLGLDDETAVSRVSMLHYNTSEEVDRLIKALESIEGFQS